METTIRAIKQNLNKLHLRFFLPCHNLSLSSSQYISHYYEFTGVSSCWDVVQLYRLMWTSVVLNVIGLFLGIITAAILGAYKDIVVRSPRGFNSLYPHSLPTKQKPKTLKAESLEAVTCYDWLHAYLVK